MELLGQTGGLHIAAGPDRGSALIEALSNPVVWTRDLGLHRMGVTPTVGFLGFIPLIGGLAGLVCFRGHPWAKPLALGGLVCFVLALGPDLVVHRAQILELPMPADLLSILPGISKMGTTVRFLTGTAFVLVVGLALGVEWLEKWIRGAGGGSGLVMALGALSLLGVGAEWLYGTPSPVPMQANAAHLPQGLDALPESGAVLAIPVQGGMPPEAHLWLGVVHGQPVVGYCAEGLEQMRERLELVDYVQGGPLPDPSAVQAELQALSEQGISYLVFVATEPGADRFRATQGIVQRLLGPPDALGDSLIGYRTAR
jgi:hypothetical protein